MTAYFYRPLRIFPQELHSPHTHSGKNADETAFLATPDTGTGIAPTRRRGQIESQFSLFSLTDTRLR
jgi:hypothetical protein